MRGAGSRWLVRTLLLWLMLAPVAAGQSDAAGVTATTARALVAQPPTQPATGPGGRAASFDGVVATRHGAPPTGYWLFEPAHSARSGMVGFAAEPLPFVIFLHGFGAIDPVFYRAWIDHIVRRGAIVVYPEYQTLDILKLDPATYLPNALTAVRAALAELRSAGRSVPDLSRVAVVGHSVGGVLAPSYAAVAASEELPAPTALMAVEPGGCVGCGVTGRLAGVPFADLHRIAAETRALVVVGANDTSVGDVGGRIVWAGMTQVPLDRRDYVTIVSDAHGRPALKADHGFPLTGGPKGPGGAVDALDWYGTWKLFDALTACAFAGRDCGIALGGTPQQRFMGRWSDGTPVAPARVTDAPPAPAP